MLVKAKVKTYPDGSVETVVYRQEFVSGTPVERSGSYVPRDERTDEEIELEREQDIFANLTRVKRKIKDYVLCNDFDMFWTITFNKDRHDSDKCFSKFRNWLKFMRKKDSTFSYIFVPERHEDGAIHFHGVTSGFKGKMFDSGIKKKGLTVYNSGNWKHGFSTVTMIQHKGKTASYLSKYITKGMDTSAVEKGKKKYWLSNGLRLPVEQYLDYDPIPENEIPSFVSESVAIYKSTL